MIVCTWRPFQEDSCNVSLQQVVPIVQSNIDRLDKRNHSSTAIGALTVHCCEIGCGSATSVALNGEVRLKKPGAPALRRPGPVFHSFNKVLASLVRDPDAWQDTTPCLCGHMQQRHH